MLLDLFKAHNERVASLLGNGFEPNTLKGYKTTIKHLTAFIKMNYHKTDFEIDRLSHEFIMENL